MLDGMYDAVGAGDGSAHGEPDRLFQQTLKTSISCSGVGLHSGVDVTMTLNPAPADHGIVFRRSDLETGDRLIPAHYDAVSDVKLCSVIRNDAGVSVGTIEHLMAALAALGIDNVLIELDGPEVPAMDGSSEPFAFLIDCAGIVEQDAPRYVIKVLKTVRVEHGASAIEIAPSDRYAIELAIDFNSGAIGRQQRSVEVSAGDFRAQIAKARTFGFRHEVEAMREMGLGLGGSLQNAVVIDGDSVMNEEGLRYDDEFVRHKILDCIGDLALAGWALKGHVTAERTGHALNNKLLHALFADPSNWERVPVSETQPHAAYLSAAE